MARGVRAFNLIKKKNIVSEFACNYDPKMSDPSTKKRENKLKCTQENAFLCDKQSLTSSKSKLLAEMRSKKLKKLNKHHASDPQIMAKRRCFTNHSARRSQEEVVIQKEVVAQKQVVAQKDVAVIMKKK